MFLKTAKRIIKIFAFIFLVFWQSLFMLSGIPKAQAQGSWWDSAWTYRKQITIDYTKVSDSLESFPVLVNLSTDSDLASDAQDDGDDIAFVDFSGTKLSHEIESFNGSTGKLVAWVKIPALSSSANTIIFLYYGNSGAVNQENVADVWSNHYKGVWHLSETPDTNTSTFEMLDSLNYNNLTTVNGTGGSIIADSNGKINGDVDFATASTTMKIWKDDSDSNLAVTSAITLEAWVNHRAMAYGSLWSPMSKINQTSSTYDYGFTCLTSVSPCQMRFVMYNTSGSVIFSSNGLYGANTAISDGNWQYFAGTYDGSHGAFYLNAGDPKYTGDQSATIRNTSGSDFLIGNFTSNHEWNGLIDEVRVSDIARSQPWIQTQYNNQNSPSTFYELGSEAEEPTFSQSSYRFFNNNNNSADVGSVLANQDTAAVLENTGDAFRLRALLHIAGGQLDQDSQQLKLQFAEKSGTCDTGFSGESYADVTAATAIAYNNNASPSDGDNLTANANDPVHSGHNTVEQDYEEANNFSNTVAAVPSGEDGEWDFSLIDNGAPGSTGYCFRIVKSNGTLLDDYTTVPQITTAVSGSLGVDIVDADGSSVASPSISFAPKNFNWSGQQSTGTLGFTTPTVEKIRVNNTTGAPGWTLSLSATDGTSALWSDGSHTYDFNDSSSAGRLQVAPTSATITPQGGCSSAGLNKQSAAYFDSGNSVDIIITSGSEDANCYWDITGIGLTQDIPAAQNTGSYSINMTLTVS